MNHKTRFASYSTLSLQLNTRWFFYPIPPASPLLLAFRVFSAAAARAEWSSSQNSWPSMVNGGNRLFLLYTHLYYFYIQAISDYWFCISFLFFSGCLTFSVQTLSHIFFLFLWLFRDLIVSVCWGKRKNCVIGWMRPWLPAAFIYGNSIETAVFLFLLTVVTHMPNLNRSQAPKLLFIRRSMLTLFIIQQAFLISFYDNLLQFFKREAGHQPDRFCLLLSKTHQLFGWAALESNRLIMKCTIVFSFLNEEISGCFHTAPGGVCI